MRNRKVEHFELVLRRTRSGQQPGIHRNHMPCVRATIPGQASEVRYGLRPATTAYQISSDGIQKEVPSEVNVSGGGEEREREFVNFYLDLPLERAERDLEARRYLDRLQKKTPGVISDSQSKQMLEGISQFVSQHRAGHFRVECRVLGNSRRRCQCS
jgi:hypothetical protein